MLTVAAAAVAAAAVAVAAVAAAAVAVAAVAAATAAATTAVAAGWPGRLAGWLGWLPDISVTGIGCQDLVKPITGRGED